MLTLVDLIGFDNLFTQKIMNGDDFSLISQSESMTESQIEKLVNDCNDNNMFSLWNFIISLEDSSNSI